MRRFALILVSCLFFYLMLFQLFRVLTDVGSLRTEYPHVFYDKTSKRDWIELKKAKPANWVPINSVSNIAVAAIVISEDWAFYQHNGFDWEQIWDSFQTNLKEGRFARGGSTITQQVAKNVFLSNEKTLLRKAQEAVLAFRLERQLTKRRILEVYLNIAEFGEGVYGIGPAARLYFGKSPASLTAKEGAFLAMLLPSPKKYSISHRKRELTRYASSTMRGILNKLLVTRRLSFEEYSSALATPLSFEARAQVMKESEDTEIPSDEIEEEEIAPDQTPAPGEPE